MGFDTPFHPENRPDALFDFGFYKVQRHTKAAIVGMLKNFFDTINSIYKVQIPEILEIGNSGKDIKTFVDQNFPYKERVVPIILVAIKNAIERKLYIGADNLSHIEIIETSTGLKKAVNVYTGAADVNLALIVVSDTPDHRMRYAEMINMCFTHYYRWQYFYTTDNGDGPHGDMFSIVPTTQPLEFGTESETKDLSDDTLLYLTDVSMKAYVEYSFRDTSEIHSVMDELGVRIDPKSGPTERGVLY